MLLSVNRVCTGCHLDTALTVVAFEEIARAWSAALLWKALHLRMVGYRCATSEIRIVACGLKHADPEHNPAVGYLHHSGMLLTDPACALHRLFRSPA